MIAPGATSRVERFRAVANRKQNTKTIVFRTNEPTSVKIFDVSPNESRPLVANVDRIVVPMTPKPAVNSSSRLRPRATNGLGQLLRGTFQPVFIAYGPAWATPIAPYSEPTMPTTRPVVPPLI